MRTPRVLRSVLVLLAALLLQVGLASRLPLPGSTPDVILVTVIALALAHGPLHGAVAGFASGLALDVIPPADHAAGRWALVMCLVGYVAGLYDHEAERSAFLPFAVVAIASAVGTLLYAGLGVVIGDTAVTWGSVLEIVPTAVLYDVVLTPFIVLAVMGLARRTSPDPLRR